MVFNPLGENLALVWDLIAVVISDITIGLLIINDNLERLPISLNCKV
jgi:hypothetical protein